MKSKARKDLTGKRVKIFKKNLKIVFVRKNQKFSQIHDGIFHFLMRCLFHILQIKLGTVESPLSHTPLSHTYII